MTSKSKRRSYFEQRHRDLPVRAHGWPFVSSRPGMAPGSHEETVPVSGSAGTVAGQLSINDEVRRCVWFHATKIPDTCKTSRGGVGRS